MLGIRDQGTQNIAAVLCDPVLAVPRFLRYFVLVRFYMSPEKEKIQSFNARRGRQKKHRLIR